MVYIEISLYTMDIHGIYRDLSIYTMDIHGIYRDLYIYTMDIHGIYKDLYLVFLVSKIDLLVSAFGFLVSKTLYSMGIYGYS